MLFANRFLLKRLLGRGGFSEVWLVENTMAGNTKMALKIYAPETGLDDDGMQIFSSEFQLGYDLFHPNILCPSYFDVYEGSPFLVMPYCEQGSAANLIGRISENEAWSFLFDVASGLDYLHNQKPTIIHQDIKPANILIDRNGHFLITDFGISAKARSSLQKEPDSTRSGGGTIAYMPPERFDEDRPPVRASDIWSLGATLFELLEGDVPFGEHGGLILKSDAPIPNLSGDWSDELKRIVTQCLQKETWDRPTAEDIMDYCKSVSRRPASQSYQTHINKKPKAQVSPSKPKVQVSHSKPNHIRDSKSRKSKKGIILVGVLVAACIIGFILYQEFKDIFKPPIVTETIAQTPSPVSTPTEYKPITIYQDTSAIENISQTAANTPDTSWITDYDQYVSRAKSAYNRGNYDTALREYKRALTLVRQKGDNGRESIITAGITECNREINAQQERRRQEEANRQAALEEQRKKEGDLFARDNRLQAYNFVGDFILGNGYMVVQQKFNNHWGIIDKDGFVKESFNYTQISERLKYGFYALRNDQGWVVFGNSANKLADNLDNLDNYR
jgi:serine/threonine protein kinase